MDIVITGAELDSIVKSVMFCVMICVGIWGFVKVMELM